MKIMLKIWILYGILVAGVIAQKNYDSDYLNQEAHYDSDDKSYHPSSNRHQQVRSYEPASYEDIPSSDPRHYQSLEQSYHKQTPESYDRQPRYHSPQQIQYHQPEDPSYHRPQEIVYHQAPQHYQDVPKHQQSYERPSHYIRPEENHHQQEEPSYHKPHEIVYHQAPQHYQEVSPGHQQSYEDSTHYQPPEEKESPKYVSSEEPKYSPPRSSHSSHPAPVPTDPKLPLYFTMYEKRVIQDPLDKYGKGPWRYLTYGHGITYGSKEPGKVFEKGYGYIRALGRDHCKLPEHLCPSREEKPFDYEGRKEPYFGYRPH